MNTTEREENELAQWCDEQRENRDNLTPKQIKMLEEIPGWDWTIQGKAKSDTEPNQVIEEGNDMNKITGKTVVRFESNFDVAYGGSVTLFSETIRQFLRSKPDHAYKLVFNFALALSEELGNDEEEQDECLKNIMLGFFANLEEIQNLDDANPMTT